MRYRRDQPAGSRGQGQRSHRLAERPAGRDRAQDLLGRRCRQPRHAARPAGRSLPRRGPIPAGRRSFPADRAAGGAKRAARGRADHRDLSGGERLRKRAQGSRCGAEEVPRRAPGAVDPRVAAGGPGQDRRGRRRSSRPDEGSRRPRDATRAGADLREGQALGRHGPGFWTRPRNSPCRTTTKKAFTSCAAPCTSA